MLAWAMLAWVPDLGQVAAGRTLPNGHFSSLFLTFPHFSSLFSFLKRGLAAVPPNLSTMVRNWSFPVRTFPPRAMVGHFGGAPWGRFCLGFALIMPVHWGVF